MALYDNIQIISTGLYGASEFLKWYLYQPLTYIHQYTPIAYPQPCPPFKPLKPTCKFSYEIIKNNSLEISRKFFYKYFADTNKMFIFVVLKKQRDI